jgi:hypothetical protein
MVRRKITRLFQADAGDFNPLGCDGREFYPVVVSCYCADSATDNDERDLRAFLDQVLGHEVAVETHELPSHEALGYTGIVLGHAVKRASR